MGNLLFVATLATKQCTLQKNSSRWFSIQAPWKGSAVGEKLEELCKDKGEPFYNIPGLGKISAKHFREFLREKNYCDKTSPRPYPVYETIVPGYKSRSAAFHKTIL